jgi:hypothetical protein
LPKPRSSKAVAGALLQAVAGVLVLSWGVSATFSDPVAGAPDLASPAPKLQPVAPGAPAAEVAASPPPTATGRRLGHIEAPRPRPGAGTVPVRLALPRQHVTATTVPVGVGSSGALDLPADPRVVGWWSGGALPGSTSGSVVLAGHLDAADQGPGALAALLRVAINDPVEVAGLDGSVLRYRVTARHTQPKSQLPRRLFQTDGAPVLTLVTCGGPYDRSSHHYRDNVVVTAAPVTNEGERAVGVP